MVNGSTFTIMSNLLSFNYETKKAIVGGLIAMGITLAGSILLGRLSGYEAKKLIIASVPSINMLCNTVILASATILALLLTALGMSARSNQTFQQAFYLRIKKIAQFDALLFITSMLVFLIINIPIVESEEIPSSWYNNLYFISLGAASLIGGFLITVVIMLYSTISDLITIFGGEDSKEHPFVAVKEEEEEEVS
jgi:hypothetical protein